MLVKGAHDHNKAQASVGIKHNPVIHDEVRMMSSEVTERTYMGMKKSTP